MLLETANRRHRTIQDMGTNHVVATIKDEMHSFVAKVGDSRLYVYRLADGLPPDTRDHSLVEEMVSNGRNRQKRKRQEHIRRENNIPRSYRWRTGYVDRKCFASEHMRDDIIMMCLLTGLTNYE